MATPWLTGQGSQAQEVPPEEFTSSEIFPETSNEIACEQCGLDLFDDLVQRRGALMEKVAEDG